MQAIAGIHYNFSMPEIFWEPYQKICQHTGSIQEFWTEKYLGLIRNFHRYSWLLIYLFGASPAACKCFVEGREHNLQEFDETSLGICVIGSRHDLEDSQSIALTLLLENLKVEFPEIEKVKYIYNEK